MNNFKLFCYILGNAFNSNIKFRNQTRNLGTARESANYRNIIESNFEKGVSFINYILNLYKINL